MRTKNNINRTLEKYLFTTPIPIRNQKEYSELFDFIFPSKDLFTDFLKEENFEKQVCYSEQILMRLSYDSFFGPPTKLLWNLLDMETKLSAKGGKPYNGKDHFVHIVHLYLLGIYMFFYHQVLNENIFAEFKKKRKITNIKSNNVTKSIIKDFIVAWRYFVLYHDISYPIEYFLGNKDNSRKEYLKDFNDIPKLVYKDLTIKSLAKFIGTYKLIKSASKYGFENLLSSCEESLNDLQSYSNYYLIDRIQGYETYRDVYTLLNKQNIVAVLYEKNSPMLIFIPKTSDSTVPLTPIKTKNYKQNKLLSEIEKSNNAPYNKSYFNLKNYSWEYYINSSVDLKELIHNIYPGIIVSDFDAIVNYIHGSPSSDYSMVFSDTDFKQYCFNIYADLYKLAGYQKLQEIENETDSLTKVANDVGGKISKKIAEVLEILLSQNLKNIDFKQDMLKNNTLDKVILSYLTQVAESYEDLSKKIADPLKEEIENQFYQSLSFKGIRKSIIEIFEQKDIKSKLEINIESNTLSYQELLESKDDFNTQIITLLDSKITHSDLLNLSTLLEYKPPHSCYDHGIVSGLIFLSIIDIHRQLLLRVEADEDFKKLLSVAIGIDFENDRDYLNYKIDDNYKVNNIFVETLFAILIHNLYPKHYSKKPKYKTKLYNNPFAYFGIFLDSIQPWDRKAQVNQAYDDLPYQTLSRGFDISIKNNKIRISEFDSRINIPKRHREMNQQLNEYLENASNFIELNLGEF